MCEQCLYKENCQFLATHKKTIVNGCTAFKSEADFKSKYAREIFEEIEKSVANIKYTVDSPRYTHIPVETMVEVCNWILQECIPKRIAELKKKYTEDMA